MADTFYAYFKENMDGLGLPCPESLFGTVAATVTSATAILKVIDTFGRSVTIADVIGAGTKLEALGVIGACSAAYYVGAVIGSLAIATQRKAMNGVSLADVLEAATKNRLSRTWLPTTMAKWPALYQPNFPGRKSYLIGASAR